MNNKNYENIEKKGFWFRFKVALDLNNKYKIKLIFIICIVFSLFAYILLSIINSTNTNDFIIDIEETSILGKFITSKSFKAVTKILFSTFNFGPSYETLLGLMILSFFIIILLICLSFYIKLFLIPLTFIVSCILYKLIDKEHYIKSIKDILINSNFKVVENPSIKEIIQLNSQELWDQYFYDKFNNLYSTYITIYENQYPNIDIEYLRLNIINNNISTDLINEYILSYIHDTIIKFNDFINISSNLNQIGFSIDGSIGSPLFIGISSICVIGLLVFAYSFGGSLYNYILTINQKIDKLHDITKKQTEFLGKTSDEVVELGLDSNKALNEIKDLHTNRITDLENIENLAKSQEALNARIDNLQESVTLVNKKLGKDIIFSENNNVSAILKNQEEQINSIESLFNETSNSIPLRDLEVLSKIKHQDLIWECILSSSNTQAASSTITTTPIETITTSMETITISLSDVPTHTFVFDSLPEGNDIDPTIDYCKNVLYFLIKNNLYILRFYEY